MDRSRIIIAILLVVTLLSMFLSIVGISVSSSTDYQSPTDSFFSAGSAGIALIEIHGPIYDGRGRPGQPGADRIVSQLKMAEETSSIRGVILAINSPGGTVGATKKIYNAVVEAKRKKPVIAVVSDIAASGGYYVASASDKIFAYDGSIIGSIGVISFHFSIREFLNRYGVSVTPIKAGRSKDSSYPFREMTGEEQANYERVLDDAYQMFLADVAEGRKQSIQTVRGWADGKIYSGRQAKAEQLIDDLGGMPEAVAAMKIMLKTKDDLPVLEPRRDFFEDLFAVGLSSNASFSDRLGAEFLHAPALFYFPSGHGQLDIVGAVRSLDR